MLESCSKVLPDFDLRVLIEKIISDTLRAADPYSAVKRLLKIQAGYLKVADQSITLNSMNKIRLIAIGKAAPKMAAGAIDALENHIFDGIVITKTIPDQANDRFPANIQVMLGGHPLPTEESMHCGQEIQRFLQDGNPDDLIIAFISGGGSALVQLPIEGITLPDLQRVTRALLRCGASIEELNTVRKHLDQLKGGGLLRLAEPASVISFLISDVMDDPLDMIASGMTAASHRNPSAALDVLERYDLIPETPISVYQVLQEEVEQQNRKEVRQADLQSHQPAKNTVILNNSNAVEGAMSAASQAGWNVENLGWVLQGEAGEAGKRLAGLISMAATDTTSPKPICLVGGGESIVHVQGKGVGGRNLEIALGAVAGLAGLKNVALVTLATDGEDGQTGVAGAVVTENTQRIADQLGLSVQKYLAENNSYRFFEAAGGLIRTGPTGTNVNDVVILLAW